MVKKSEFFILMLVFLVLSSSAVLAFEFNGTIKDESGNSLNNSLINITIRSSSFQITGYNFTFTNASGWFNLSVTDVANGFYEPIITLRNASTNSISHVGQSLPAFPSQVLQEVAGTTFFLKEAGTINITAVNSSGGRISFNYQIKDKKLGYPIAMNFDSGATEENIVVPKNRNYSIMIYPDESMPVSFDWTNFSSTSSYTINGISSYNATTSTLHKQFNTTLSIVRISGYFNFSNILGFNELKVIPYLLEPGNMVHEKHGVMPFNLSSFNGGSDSYNLSTGFFNISLPATVETSAILLFATAKNGSSYYGGFRNASLVYGSAPAETTNFNFTQTSGLLGTPANISMETIDGSPNINVTTAKQSFNLLNSTNGSLSGIYAHIETTLDYTQFGAIEFTLISNIEQGESASFSIPLINSTGIKEMNIYVSGGNFAPKKISKSAAQIISNNNITITPFDPGGINAEISDSGISMAMYISNSSCDVPSPASACVVGGSDQNLSSFNPMKAIIGGGKLSFRMGTGNIKVHYVNVDMIASGPPDALFDNSTTDKNASGSFESALRFGSGGPTIYDFAFISAPYSTTAGSGLNESSQVNISIPFFYDDEWNVIWNATANGTSAAALAGNYSYYSTRQSEWQTLLSGTICHENPTQINTTNPCYIDKSSNVIWIRIPHFSGTGPKISGSALASSSSSSSSSSSTSGAEGSNTSSIWKKTFVPSEAEVAASYTKELSENERVRVKVGNETHHVGILDVSSTKVKIEVNSTPQNATLEVGDVKKFEVTGDDYYDLSVKLNSINSTKANITILYVYEKVPETSAVIPLNESAATAGQNATAGRGAAAQILKNPWFYAVLGVLIVAGGVWYYIRRRNMRKMLGLQA